MNIQNKPPYETPRRIQVSPRDNAAIIVNGLGLPAGTVFVEKITEVLVGQLHDDDEFAHDLLDPFDVDQERMADVLDLLQGSKLLLSTDGFVL